MGLRASGDLLHGPTVAVRIAEEDERSPIEFLDLTDIDSTLDELFTGGVDVRNHQLKPLDGAGRHPAQPGPQGDRTGRSGRRELDEADRIADLVVMIGIEAGLLRVEGLRAVHI